MHASPTREGTVDEDFPEHRRWRAEHEDWRIDHQRLLAAVRRIEAELHEHEAALLTHEREMARAEARLALRRGGVPSLEDRAGHTLGGVLDRDRQSAQDRLADCAAQHERIRARHRALCRRLEPLLDAGSDLLPA